MNGLNEDFGFDIGVAAQAYAQIAGIVAGFAFAALAILIQEFIGKKSDDQSLGRVSDDFHIKQALIFLGMTFVGNLLAAIFWGLVAGEHGGSIRREVQGFIATLNWSLATPITFQSLVFILAIAGKLKEALRTFVNLFYLAIALGFMFLLLTTADVAQHLRGGITPVELCVDNPENFIFMIIMVIGLAAATIIRKAKIPSEVGWRRRLESIKWFANFWFGLLLVSAAVFVFVAGSPSRDVGWFPRESWPLWLFNTAWLVLAIWAIRLIPSLPPQRNPLPIRGRPKQKRDDDGQE